MTVVLSPDSAQKAVDQSADTLQRALIDVQTGKYKLEQAVANGEVTKGSPEYLNLKNKLVNSAEAQAETAQMQLDSDKAALQSSLDYEKTGNFPGDGPASQTSPNQDPAGAPKEPEIISANQIEAGPELVSPEVDPEASLAPGEELIPLNEIQTEPEPIDAYPAGLQTFDDGSTLQTFDDGSTLATDTDGELSASDATDTSYGSPASSAIAGAVNARNQQTISTQTGQMASVKDWRVRISLAAGANYLYNATPAGILQPLQATNGVIFPYTPKVDTGYRANYSQQELTHANFKSYSYQNSHVNDISISGLFTAQNTNQANYLLAVIHFFRSVTKMFYGQDAQRGAPPPLVFLNGFGQYQFSNHPCVVTEFTYNLPDDVDYIRAGVTNNVGLNMATVSNVLNSAVASGKIGGAARLAAAFTTPGALPPLPWGSPATAALAPGVPTMVPTKMTINIKLLPINSRQQISKQFSVKDFANGNLIKGGFW